MYEETVRTQASDNGSRPEPRWVESLRPQSRIRSAANDNLLELPSLAPLDTAKSGELRMEERGLAFATSASWFSSILPRRSARGWGRAQGNRYRHRPAWGRGYGAEVGLSSSCCRVGRVRRALGNPSRGRHH